MRYEIISERNSKYQVKIAAPEDAYAVLKRFATMRQEHFLLLTLDGAHQVIRSKIVTIGLTNRTIVHPREVFKPAIADAATSVVIAHNHPSGNVEPSPEDRDITYRLVKAGAIIGIEVLDHIIIGKQGYFSFLEHGLMQISGGTQNGND
ncbi:MAG: DNA repair protein RadC [Chloroflexi bacterium HGW-Chloroflexi-5]|jgi:DNA repair protein RadC|nr:MAG: DNA repair protein RadC [Spirochaetae bacterium HGW-Spirochaetae-3]PKN98230.1 MAG: DNA repair protein RadC [Chloroflexi bacterium HGW-Chloroflexi-5]